MSNTKTNLVGMREAAEISQMDMARYLGVSQSQISRYEKDPEDMPMRAYNAWISYCGDVSSKRALSVGTPMQEIDGRIALIESYMEAGPFPSDDLTIEEIGEKADIADPIDIMEGIRRVGRKPRIGFFGRFDMGKSRLANMLMGGDSLPASYQPATSIVCLVRHMDEKPSWQPEKVWIMDSGFDLNRADDEEHCMSHRLVGGGYEALSEHGTHQIGTEKQAVEGASAAVVYIDSEFLNGCDLIDLPGYGHKQGDDERAEMAQSLVDVIVYVSNITGFMNESDRAYLGQLLQHLPPLEKLENGLPPLRNLMVVATRADTAAGGHDEILTKAAHSCYDGIGERLEKRGQRTNVFVDETKFRNRFFTYSVEVPELRQNFERDLQELVQEMLPKKTLQALNDVVKSAKNTNAAGCEKLIESIESALNKREQAQKEIEHVRNGEKDRIVSKDRHKEEILRLIDDLETESLEEARQVLGKWSNVEHLESIITKRYSDKKEARKLAPTYIMESIQEGINESLTDKSDRLGTEVDALLSSYDINIEKNPMLEKQWSFNAKGAFISALASLGTFGALASWASAVAAGSNLGAYLLIGKVVSALAAIGIPLGGTGAVFSIISVMGGPITVGIGIAVAVGILTATIFGDSWQKKLAKQVSKGLSKEEAENQVISQLRNFWSQTREGFNHAISETENDYQQKLDALENIAYETDSEKLETQLSLLVELRDFFAGIPWKPIKPRIQST